MQTAQQMLLMLTVSSQYTTTHTVHHRVAIARVPAGLSENQTTIFSDQTLSSFLKYTFHIVWACKALEIVK